MKPSRLRSGAWCPKCSKEEASHKMRCSFEDIAFLATSKNGNLLTKTYKNDSTKMQWKCEKGHIWLASAGNIKQGHWCPACVGQSWQLDKESFTKKMMTFYRKLASQNGGDCLSNEYKNAHAKLKWKCKKGHKWETSPRNVQLGSWCRVCRYGNRTKKT